MIHVPENKRLKQTGLALVSGAALIFFWLSGEASAHWPLDSQAFLTFLLATFAAVNITAAGILLIAAGCGATRSWRDPRRRRALALQVLLANVLVPAVIYAILSSDESIENTFVQSGWDFPFSVALAVVSVTAWRIWRRAQRHEAPSAEEAMARDPRSPVLYLRSFKDDGAALIDDGGWPWVGRLMGLIATQTPEQELAEILGQVGPVIAIGKPGEPLPELGAARLYVSHDTWQDAVMNLMRQASLVVVRVGASAGVLWEIETALAHLPRQRVVFALLGGRALAPELASRLSPMLGPDFHAALPQPQPSLAKWTGWNDPRRRIGSFICFAVDGSPRVVSVTSWPLWGRDMFLAVALRPAAMQLRRAWRQVFAHLGLETASVRRPSRGVAVLLALLFGYAGAHWFYLGNARRGWTYVALFPLLLASLFMGVADAVRFILMDRTEFDRAGAR
jgi:TM2 domain-containing membrane protein YozV